MILLVTLFVLSVLLNIVLLRLYTERKYSCDDKSDSYDEFSKSLYGRQRERIRADALFCKERLATIVADMEKSTVQ